MYDIDVHSGLVAARLYQRLPDFGRDFSYALGLAATDTATLMAQEPRDRFDGIREDLHDTLVFRVAVWRFVEEFIQGITGTPPSALTREDSQKAIHALAMIYSPEIFRVYTGIVCAPFQMPMVPSADLNKALAAHEDAFTTDVYAFHDRYLEPQLKYTTLTPG